MTGEQFRNYVGEAIKIDDPSGKKDSEGNPV